jgi:hypothetical protein
VIASDNRILVEATLISSSSSDDDWARGAEDEVLEPSRTRQPLKPAIHEFNAEGVSPEAFHAFSDLLETEAFHNVTTFRKQVALAVEHLRPDGLSIPYSQIGKIFGISKGAVTPHYQRYRCERRRDGRTSSINGDGWEQVRAFVYERFTQVNPVTTEELVDSLSGTCGVYIPMTP